MRAANEKKPPPPPPPETAAQNATAEAIERNKAGRRTIMRRGFGAYSDSTSEGQEISDQHKFRIECLWSARYHEDS